MKELNQLMNYRSYYEYDFDCEVIRVKDGEQHDEAKELYAHIVTNYILKDSDKWRFDIALDCVCRFTAEECRIINNQGEIGDYHFGYGLYVRNHYVYPSRLHRYFMADSVSSRVESFIYAIMFPDYICFKDN